MRLSTHVLIPAVVSALAAAVVILAVLLATDDSEQTKAAPAGHSSLLFVQTATSGTATVDKNGHGTLVLQGVDPYTVQFADRPTRRAGDVSTHAFLQAWSGYGFGKDPPNAALVISAANVTAVVEISNPRAAGTTLTYDVSKVEADASTRLSAIGGRTLPALPRSFGHSSLFIDDASGGCAINNVGDVCTLVLPAGVQTQAQQCPPWSPGVTSMTCIPAQYDYSPVSVALNFPLDDQHYANFAEAGGDCTQIQIGPGGNPQPFDFTQQPFPDYNGGSTQSFTNQATDQFCTLIATGAVSSD